jgi:transcriptional regulator with XRE-family HTH domain
MSLSPKEKIERAIQARGITVSDLAEALGIKRRSLENLIRGSAQSRSTQQRITNFLQQSKIWHGIEVTERIATLPVGTIIALPDEDAVKRFIDEAGAIGYAFSANAARLECAAALHFGVAGQKFPPREFRNHAAHQ